MSDTDPDRMRQDSPSPVTFGLTSILEHHASRYPNDTALEFQGAVTTWADLLRETRATAGALAVAGVRRGDIVGVLLHNSDRYLVLMHAISHLGAVLMPLNWRLAGPELGYILAHAETRVVISEPELKDLVDSADPAGSCTRLLIDDTDCADGRWTSLAELLRTSSPIDEPADLGLDDLHRLMYTSGTTSRPKGVMITYQNLYAKNLSHLTEFQMSRTDINLVCGPLYHVGGLDLTTTTLMYLGAPTHILRRFDARAVLDAIEQHRVTALWLAPVMINQVMAEPTLTPRDLTSVRLIIDGGEKMPLPLIDRVLSTFPNTWFADGYGLTETVSGDTFLDKRHSRHKIGSVGRPVLHTQVRVVREDGSDAGPDEPGEILLRGPKVFRGYWRDPESTAAALRGGWFHTGDIGQLDGEGYLYISDRLKDIIISGGENISSLEVERVLYEHPAVSEAAVVARPHPQWLEVPVAYVVITKGPSVSENELSEHCRQRLAKYKVPTAFRMIDELPRNPSGKILKRELRQIESERQ